MKIDVQTNLREFNATLAEYARLSKKSLEEILPQKADQLGFVLWKTLLLLRRPKGAIRAEILGNLEHGRGVLVRPSIREKVFGSLGAHSRVSDRKVVFGKKSVGSKVRSGSRLNLQALAVEREINTRESGRGYTAFGSRMRRVRALHPRETVFFSGRYQQKLGKANFRVSTNETSILVTLGGPKVGLGKSLSQPRAQAAIASSLRTVRSDMLVYIKRKQLEAAKSAGLGSGKAS